MVKFTKKGAARAACAAKHLRKQLEIIGETDVLNWLKVKTWVDLEPLFVEGVRRDGCIPDIRELRDLLNLTDIDSEERVAYLKTQFKNLNLVLCQVFGDAAMYY